jgi:hypothetical protein
MTNVPYVHGKGLPVYGNILSPEIIKVTHEMIKDVITVPHAMVLKMCILHDMVNVVHGKILPVHA